ncbi:hypothetical protein QWZ02_06240 [Kinneretia asaccharophila]|nr:hypothetical protein [Roseateles asaccharophilus]
MHFKLVGIAGKSSILFIRDGHASEAINTSEEAVVSQFLLEDDIERHTLVITVGARLSLSFDVSLHAYRTWTKERAAYVSAPKWNELELALAAETYLRGRPKNSRNRATFDSRQMRLVDEPGLSHAQRLMLLHDELVKGLGLLAQTNAADLVHDYGILEDVDIDIEETLEFLRSHPSILRESCNGPVIFRGARYTPAKVLPRAELSRRLDLSVPLHVLAQAREALSQDKVLGLASVLVRELSQSLMRFSATGQTASAEKISSWFAKTPNTLVARALKTNVFRIWWLCLRLTSVSDATTLTSRVLRDGFRDFDLFEWAVLHGVAEALSLGAPRPNLHEAKIRCGDSTVINPNASGGAQLVSELLPGWRDSTSFKSNFRPDLVINYYQRAAIPVDAKFRVADGFLDPCSAGSLKEVQAYLNEFGSCGALIVVPLIPASLDGSGSGAVRVAGDIFGREYRVWILEYSPALPGFSDNLFRALEDIAQLSDFYSAP